MSLIAPLRASAARSPLAVGLRFASSSANASSSRPPATSSVQRADEQLALRQKQQASMRKGGKHMDLMSANVQILEFTVEPPFQPSWIFKKGFYTYIVDRAKRYWGGTRASLLSMRKRGAAHQQLGQSTFQSLWMLFTNRRPSTRFRPMLEDLTKVYAEYNQALASGDAPLIRSISLGQALTHGQTVIKANRKMSWELVKEVEQPKIMWARVAQIQDDNEVGQVAVKFDTEQALTTVQQGKKTTKKQRVVENYVFERMMPVRDGWKIKQRLEETPPPIGDRFQK